MDRAIGFTLFVIGTLLGALLVMFVGKSTKDSDIRALNREVASLRDELTKRDTPVEEPDIARLVVRERERAEQRAQTITELFEREVVDPLWGPAMQREIRDRFDREEPHEFELISAKCKATLCIVEIATPSRDMNLSLPTWPTWFGLPRGFVLTRAPDQAGVRRTVAFLAREGHFLPEQSS